MSIPLNAIQKKLRSRLLEVCFERKASHLGSSLSSLDTIEAIYQTKSAEDEFILSNGHAGYALYTVLEHHKLLSIKPDSQLNVHPERSPDGIIPVTTGSLGQGLPIAVGLAIADPNKNIFCMISDGEAAEGSVWEALRLIQDLKVKNIMILVNANGWGAYSTIDTNGLYNKLKGFGYQPKKCNGHNMRTLANSILSFKEFGQPQMLFCHTTVDQFEFLKGQDAHYYVMKKADYDKARKALAE